MAKLDIKQHVTDTIIAQIEAGTAPWRKPWTGGAGDAGFPMRHNGEAYKGINVLMLWATAQDAGFRSDRWMTFKQALDLGGGVRKGEKCAKSVFYGSYEAKDKAETANPDDKPKIVYAKVNNVFNAEQIDGLPAEFYYKSDEARDMGTNTDAELEAFFAKTGASIISTDLPRAFYRPSTDQIHMPPVETFHNAQGYYSVLSHEGIHWSGATMRLDRLGKFSDKKAYAFEELVAEIGSCFLCLELGIVPDFNNSSAYVEGWLEAMKGDSNLIFKAAAEAQKAVDFIKERVASKETGGEQDKAA